MQLTVLIVDDDPVARQLLSHHVAAAGYAALTAADATTALRAVEEAEPSIVMIDGGMAAPGGLDLCRRLRRFPGTDRIYAIVMLPARDEDEALAEALEAGADDGLTKPFKRRELLARLRAGARIVALERDAARRELELRRARSEREEAGRRLAEANTRRHELAQTDELTGLPNRRAAMLSLGSRWCRTDATREPLACVVLDVDHLHAINTAHGHDGGDRVLARVATALRGAAAADEVLYRIGGGAFMLLLPGATAAMAARAAERLRAAVEELGITLGAGEVRVTVSLGVGERGPSMLRAGELLEAANEALRDAKDSGRNRVRIAPGLPHPIAGARRAGRATG